MNARPADHATFADQGVGPRAGFGLRLVAAIVDTVVLLVLGLPLAFIGHDLAPLGDLVLWSAYFVALEGSTSGQTVGKRLVRIRVADVTTGGPIGWGRALLRHIGRWFSGMAFGLGYLWMLWDPVVCHGDGTTPLPRPWDHLASPVADRRR
jgi:uncharacterized RDD family membrane protein YckC